MIQRVSVGPTPPAPQPTGPGRFRGPRLPRRRLLVAAALAVLLGGVGIAVVTIRARHPALPSPPAARAAPVNTPLASGSPTRTGQSPPGAAGLSAASAAPPQPSFNPQQAVLTAADLGTGYMVSGLPPVGVGTLQTCGAPDLSGATRATRGQSFTNPNDVSSASSSVTVFTAGTARTWLDHYVALTRQCPTFSMGNASATITLVDGVNLADQTVRVEVDGNSDANSFTQSSILVRHGDTIATIELDNYSGDAVAQLDRLGALAAQRLAGAP